MPSLHLPPLVSILFIVIGTVSFFVTIFRKPKANKLKETGEHAEGIIFKLGYSTRDSSVKDKITVRFITKKQEWITKEANTDGMFLWTGQFKEGQTVPVIYDPDNPENFTIPTRQTPGSLKAIFILVDGIFVAVGIYGLFFAR